MPEKVRYGVLSTAQIARHAHAYMHQELASGAEALPVIRKDAHCLRNTIVGNNVNYCVAKGIVSEGAGSVVRDNVCLADAPYQSPEGVGTVVQSFQRELTEQAIKDLAEVRPGKGEGR